MLRAPSQRIARRPAAFSMDAPRAPETPTPVRTLVPRSVMRLAMTTPMTTTDMARSASKRTFLCL
eukprot:3162905-Lingulodinium_polyedra.AAC.1